MTLTNDDVIEILRILESSPYDELELETDQFKLTLRRATDGQWTQATRITADPGTVHTSAAAVAEPAAGAGSEAPDREGLFEVRSPLPGTFYRAPQPGAPPFVEIGNTVEENTVVCIVETMKLMNSIHAGMHGTVTQICLENAEPVEQHAVLMRIRPEK